MALLLHPCPLALALALHPLPELMMQALHPLAVVLPLRPLVMLWALARLQPE